MTNRIGPSFWAELKAAGLSADGFAIDLMSGEPTFDPKLDPALVMRIKAVIAAHDPSRAAPSPLPGLTDRQFGEGLWRDGLITYEDYLAFVGPGVIPGALMDLLNALPNDDGGDPNAVTPRRVAIGLATGAQTYLFENPLVDLIRQNKGWTVEHLRERWAAWAAL